MGYIKNHWKIIFLALELGVRFLDFKNEYILKKTME